VAKARDEPTKREAILRAAIETFLQNGFAGASMEAVATAAGVARRTVFNQFATKEALFTAAVGSVWGRMPTLEIGSDPELIADPRSGLLRMGMVIAEFWADERAVQLVRFIIAERPRFPGLAESYLTNGKLPALAGLIQYLQLLSTEGRLRCSDPDLAARQFVGLINEPLLWYRVLGLEEVPSAERRAHVVGQAVAMFLSCYPIV